MRVPDWITVRPCEQLPSFDFNLDDISDSGVPHDDDTVRAINDSIAKIENSGRRCRMKQ